MKRVVVVVHGPSLSLLGKREPHIYGTTTLSEIDAALVADGAGAGVDVRCLQTNHEGAIVDAIVGAADGSVAGMIINAGAYAHTSLAIADAIRAVGPVVPVVEVHLTNTAARDDAHGMRQRSVVGAACVGRVEGFGAESYRLALQGLLRVIDRGTRDT